MASISRDKNGNRTIQFVAADKKRRSIRLGKVTQRIAESIRLRIEALNVAIISGCAIDNETATWVAKLEDSLNSKLARAGLIPKRESQRLKEYLEAYIAKRDVKKSTATVYGHTKRNLIDYFGSDKSIRDITTADADDWRAWLKTNQKLGDSTVGRRSGIAKQFFRPAAKRGICRENPFGELKSGDQVNNSRDYFVTRAVAAKVLDACPDAEWRALFALSRYGGLRCPSEHLRLQWAHVDWAGGRVKITSPKTEHHKGGASRIIPLFPELRPYLEEAFEQAPVGAKYVIHNYRSGEKNFRTRMERIIERAGCDSWPKLFHNLRASRATELAATHPGHVAAEWMGHSTLIAQKHYWQVTEDDFKKALSPTLGKAVQKAVQDGAEPSRTAPDFAARDTENTEKYELVRQFASNLVGGEGLERNAVSALLLNALRLEQKTRAAKSGAVDADWLKVVQCWDNLSKSRRARVLSIIRAVSPAV